MLTKVLLSCLLASSLVFVLSEARFANDPNVCSTDNFQQDYQRAVNEIGQNTVFDVMSELALTSVRKGKKAVEFLLLQEDIEDDVEKWQAATGSKDTSVIADKCKLVIKNMGPCLYLTMRQRFTPPTLDLEMAKQLAQADWCMEFLRWDQLDNLD